MAKVEMDSLRILVVEDEDFMRKLVVRVLNDLGVHDVYEAVNGIDGLNKLKQARKPLDLILCDLEMPGMDGFEFVRRVRKDADVANRRIPIVILTGHSSEENINETVSLGIHGFLTKPVSKGLLESRISAAVTSPGIDPKMLDNM